MAAQPVRTVREQLADLQVVPDPMHALGQLVERAEAWQGAFGALLADNECPHGRLPSDSTPPCGCWPTEK